MYRARTRAPRTVLQRLLLALLLAFTGAVGLGPWALAVPVVINEVMASNGATIADEDEDFEDWIELHNPGASPVDLAGFHLSDDDADPLRWQFPQGVVPPNGYLLVWASGKDRVGQNGALHTNFRISADGEPLTLTAPDESTVIDHVPPTPIPRDISFGRLPDASENWVYFLEPTPNAANSTEGQEALLDPPAYSHEQGFYTAGFFLELSHPDPGAAIHYTLDGSTPTTDSPLYEAPIWIDSRAGDPNVFSLIPTAPAWVAPAGEVFKANVVRAVANRAGHVTGEAEARTYFVDPDMPGRYHVPVVSLVTDPDNFFDEDIGIYVPGVRYNPNVTRSGNYFQRGAEWERPVHLSYFEPDGTVALAQDAGVRIHGGLTRLRPQKTLRLYARGGYGEDLFNHPVYGEGEVPIAKRFLLRNSGQDNNVTMFRDAMMQELVKELGLDQQAYRPTVVFINGEYWGIKNARDRIDKYFLHYRHGVDPENVDILTRHREVVEGDTTHYDALLAFLESEDLSDPANYAQVQTMMDTENFATYQAVQIFFANNDWPSVNIDFWRLRTETYEPDAPHGHDGRWRWILYDTDFGWARYASSTHTYNALAVAADPDSGANWPNPPWATFLFRTLLENQEFRHDFINRMADHMNSVFRPEIVTAKIAEMRDEIEPLMQEHINRWRQISSMNTWRNNVQVMLNFAEQRPAHVRQHVVDFFDLPGTFLVQVDPAEAGTGGVVINTLELMEHSATWEGTYFRGVPVTITAKPQPGYRFEGWEGDLAGSAASVVLNVNEPPPVQPGLSSEQKQAHGGDLRFKPVFIVDPDYVDAQEPAPYPLASGDFSFTTWSPAEPAGTYPPHMRFYQTDQGDPGLDLPLTELWTLPYDRDNRSRINGLEDGGFAFINTSNPQEDGGGYLGAAVLALDTLGRGNVEVSWRGATILPNDRVQAIRLQYRLGGEGPFQDVLDTDGSPVEYLRNELAGHEQTLGPVRLPHHAEDHPYVQLRWRYHYLETGVSGPRAQLAVREITVSSGVLGAAQARHPADLNDSMRLTISEVTNYGAAWKQGSAWLRPPNPIPVAYVTRAGFLWRAGEAYTDIGSEGPTRWAPAPNSSVPEAGTGSAVRHVAGQHVEIESTPGPQVRAHALEEVLPQGVTPSEISDAGVWDKASRTLRWGPFFDATARTLSYFVDGEAGEYTLAGAASFDGEDITPTGAATLHIAPGEGEPEGEGEPGEGEVEGEMEGEATEGEGEGEAAEGESEGEVEGEGEDTEEGEGEDQTPPPPPACQCGLKQEESWKFLLDLLPLALAGLTLAGASRWR